MKIDAFPNVAEWIRRQKLEGIRKGGVRGMPACIVCLRREKGNFVHYYSVSPDLEAIEPHGPGSALTWATAVLGCDEYFLMTDNGRRILVQRFSRGDAAYDRKTGYPVDPPYPTTASYYYEQQGTRVVWKEVFDKELDESTPTTWDLWHCFLAGWKIGYQTWPSIQEALDQQEGLTPSQREHMAYQGHARFVSTCKGVKSVSCSNLRAAGLTKLIIFENGEPFNVTGVEY